MRDISIGLLALIVSGCAQPASPPTAETTPAAAPTPVATVSMTKERQATVTPDSALSMLKEGNARFVSGEMLERDLTQQIEATSEAQYPYASILTCIDSRSGPELVFDQGIGGVFAPRVAGNVVNEDILGSLEYASRVAGSRLVVVLGHTSCGAVKGACDMVKLGNLTPLLGRLRTVVDSVEHTGDRTSANHEFVDMVAEANVKDVVGDIRERSQVLAEMETKGEIKIVGAMLNVSTGQVTFLE
jgi:carbonic anhydrase